MEDAAQAGIQEQEALLIAFWAPMEGNGPFSFYVSVPSWAWVGQMSVPFVDLGISRCDPRGETDHALRNDHVRRLDCRACAACGATGGNRLRED